MHVEQAPRRREAVAVSERRSEGGGEQRPVHGGWVERVEVVEIACGRTGRQVRANVVSVGVARMRYYVLLWAHKPEGSYTFGLFSIVSFLVTEC